MEPVLALGLAPGRAIGEDPACDALESDLALEEGTKEVRPLRLTGDAIKSFILDGGPLEPHEVQSTQAAALLSTSQSRWRSV